MLLSCNYNYPYLRVIKNDCQDVKVQKVTFVSTERAFPPSQYNYDQYLQSTRLPVSEDSTIASATTQAL